jgi:hypothetical protein
MVTDAFFVAFKIPNLLRRLFAEGRLFPGLRSRILAQYKNQPGARRPPRAARRPRRHLRLFLALVRGHRHSPCSAAPVVALRGDDQRPGIPRGSPEKFRRSPSSLLRIIFPYILFISLTSLAGRHPQYVQSLLRACFHAGISERELDHRLRRCTWRRIFRSAGDWLWAWAVFAGRRRCSWLSMLPFLAQPSHVAAADRLNLQ